MTMKQHSEHFSNNNQQIHREDVFKVWADIDAHLQFADQVIHKCDLPSQVRTALFQQMQRIRLRQADPKMYLAVVGEFSTGKSTFINALLHEELLKTSIDVTTATSTLIQHGPQIDLEVRFYRTDETLSYTRNRVQLWKQINMLSHHIHGDSSDIHTYINAVTANNKVATQVESVVIHHPTAFLANGVVIIDTPGINAEHDTHRRVTQHVVQHEADAAVIVIPAPVPLAQTLATFLMESLRPYIHRCLFVVTQMDKIQEREQKRLLDNIRARLAKVLDTDQAIVLYEAAPQVVLDTLQKQALAPNLEHWYGKFGELEQTLWNRLRQERALSITESLLRLMTALFEELDKSLRERQMNYRTRQAAIQRETIQDISSFTARQQQSYQTMISPTVASARLEIEKYITNCNNLTEKSLYRAVFGVDSVSDLKAVMEDAVKREMQKASNDVQKQLQKCLQDLERTTAQASHSFDERFAQEYRKLRALSGTVSLSQIQKHNNNLTVNTSNIFYSADKINRELDDTVGQLGWGGAAVGAAIGTALLPGIGTVAGLLVGPLLVGLFGPSLQERKAQVWDAVRPALNSSFQTMLTQSKTVLDHYEREVHIALNQRISRYMHEYKAVVDTMIQQQQQQLMQIQRLQLTVQSNQQEIERRRNSLKQKQHFIARKVHEEKNHDSGTNLTTQ